MKRTLFYVLNFALLGLLVVAAIQDGDREWKDYQKEYFSLETERLKGELAKADSPKLKKSLEEQIAALRWRRPAIKQIMANDLGRFDRCVTCHMGMDPLANPTLTTPYKGHPYQTRDIKEHKTHTIMKFGCTSCHSGQGLATTAEDAHGFVEHWEEPMFKGGYIQASCVKCHGNFEDIEGTEVAKRGKELFYSLGCVGCHSMNGVGGEISVDLGDIADKPVSRVDWSNAGLPPHLRNIQNWIELHFTKDTMEIVPGDPDGHMCTAGQTCEPTAPSGMPPFFKQLSGEDARAITTYLMAQTDNKVPSDYFVYAAPKPEPKFASAVKRGAYVFTKYGCAGCHGEDGAQGVRNYNALGTDQKKMEDGVTATLTEIVGTYTREELKEKIQNGVSGAAISKFKADGPTPPLYMPSWEEKIKGRELEDLVTYLLSIAKEDEEEW